MRRRGQLWFVLGVAGILALVTVAYLRLMSRSSLDPVAAPPTPVAPTVHADAAQLQRADGAVEIKVGDKGWERAGAGTELVQGADLRTGPDGMATVTYGEGLSAEVQRGTSVRLDRLDSEVARLVVGEGVVVVDVAPGGRRVQLAAEGSDAVVEAKDARLAVLADGRGQLQAAVTRGEATVTAAGTQVKVGAGEQTLVTKGGAPAAPVAIPTSLLLKVQWPSATTPKRRHKITGTTSPGSLVRVGNQVIAARSDGKFDALVDLAEGPNRIVVEVVDVLGRRQRSESDAIDVDTKAPSHVVETRPEMWQR